MKVTQSPGKSVNVQLRGIEVQELKETAGSPSFCAATGNFYLYVASQ